MNKESLKLKKFHFGKSNKNIFSFKELEGLLNLRPFVNTKRFIPTEKKDYSWLSYEWQTDKTSVPVSVIKEVIKKDVVYIRDCGRANKKINNNCKQLEKIFNRPVDCHIFFSFKRNVMGFNKHHDSSNNFIVLCEGKIKVEVWNDSKVTRIMNPGEYVFIPSHTDHRIIPLSDKRLSCSFPIVEHKSAFDEREWLTL